MNINLNTQSPIDGHTGCFWSFTHRKCCDKHRRAHDSHQKAFTSKCHYCLLFSYHGEEKGLYLFFIRGSNGIKIKEYRNLIRSLQLAVGCARMGQVHAQPLRPAQPWPHWPANGAWGDHSCLSEILFTCQALACTPACRADFHGLCCGPRGGWGQAGQEAHFCLPLR